MCLLQIVAHNNCARTENDKLYVYNNCKSKHI